MKTLHKNIFCGVGSIVIALLFVHFSPLLADSSTAITGLLDDYRRQNVLTYNKRLSDLRSELERAKTEEDKLYANLALALYYLNDDALLAQEYLRAAKVAQADQKTALSAVIALQELQAKFSSKRYRDTVLFYESLPLKRLPDILAKKAYPIAVEAAFRSGDHEKAVAIYKRYQTEVASYHREESSAKYAADSAYIKGDIGLSLTILEELIKAYPLTSNSRWAFSRFIERQCELERAGKTHPFSRQTLLHLSRHISFDAGIKDLILSSVTQPMRLSKRVTRQLNLKEQIDFLFQARFYEEALELSHFALQQKEHNSSVSNKVSLYFLMGRIHSRLHNYVKAARYFSDIIAISKDHFDLHHAHEYLGDCFKHLTMYDLAFQQYSNAERYKKSSYLAWEKFWSLYKGGNYQHALKLLKSRKVQPKDRDDFPNVLYWHAKVLEKLGESKQAQNLYGSILGKYADSFYAFLSAGKITPEFRRASDKLADLKNIDNRGSAIATSFAARIIHPDAAVEINKPELVIIDQLIKFGLKDIAGMLIQDFDWRDYNKEESFTKLSRLAWILDDYQPTRRLRNNNFSALRTIPDGWMDLWKHQKTHADEWRIYYPLAFSDSVRTLANELNIDQYLLLSIMRAESFYNKNAVSPVGARGLMQLMPYTALRVAWQLHDENFDAENLSDPMQNIAYGSWYINKLLRYYSNNPYVAVAAYNAGPVAVNQWLISCGRCTTDEFVEYIPYRETRLYVKKVMTNLAFYHRIYENKEMLPALPPLPRSVPLHEEIF